MGFTDQLDRTGDGSGTLLDQVFEHLLFLLTQLDDLLLIRLSTDREQHLPERVPVIEADVIPKVMLVVELGSERPADPEQSLIMDRFRIDHDAIKIKHDRLEHGLSVGLTARRGKVTQRYFFSYDAGMKQAETGYALPSYDDALEQALSRIRPLPSEPAELSGALGCVLAEDIVADRDQPPFNRSAMDGYAVRSAEITPNTWYDVVTVIPAGSTVTDPTVLTRGVSAIATGAAVPDAYDAVIPVEQSHEQSGRVRFDVTQVKPGQHIHKRGDDARAGRVVIPAGTVMGPAQIGIAAAVGCVQPKIIRRACVSILTTGDEVRPPATPTDDLATHQIRNSNGPMLEALLTCLNTERFDQVHVRDEPDATLAALHESLNKCDLTLTVGGVSAGRRDHVPWAAGELGLETIIKGVAIQPGKPVFIAKTPGDSPRWLVGLPGNPVSVLTTAHLFVWPILRAMSGRDATLPWRSATLHAPVKPNAKREAFRTVEINDPESLRVSVLQWKGSGDLSHTARAKGFVRLPVQPDELQPGTTVPFLPMIGGEA